MIQLGLKKKTKLGFDLILTISLFVLLVFHNQLANLLILLVAHDVEAGPNLLTTDLYLRYNNAVVYGAIGFGIFFILNLATYLFFASKQNSSPLLRYCNLLTIIVQWLLFFVFWDIALQNIYNQETTFSNFAMRYQIIGGLIAVELLVIRDFFAANKKR